MEQNGAGDANAEARDATKGVALAVRGLAWAVFTAALAAVVAAELAAGAASPFIPARLLGALSLLVAATLAAWTFLVALALARASWRTSLAGRAPMLVGAAVGVAVVALAAYASSCFTIYGPYDAATYVIDGAGVVLGAGLGKLVARALGRRRTRIEGAGGMGAVASVAGAGLLVATTFFAADAVIFPSGYFLLHEGLWAVGLLALGAASAFALRSLPARHVRWVAALAGGGALALFSPLVATTASTADHIRALAVGGLISHRAFVSHVWRVFDRDGDGYARALGGADCDDADPTVFPLAVGRRPSSSAPPGAPSLADCTGLRAQEPSHLERTNLPSSSASAARVSMAGASVPVHRPRLVLLVTVDAFRCGFGEGEAQDLRDVCPALTQLGREGRLRRDVHTPATQTRWALGALLGATPGGTPLAQSFAARGVATAALPTCAYARDADGVQAFDTIDTSLVARARNGAEVVAPALHEVIRHRAIRALAGDGPPLFVWAHEMDTHAPYRETPTARLVLSPRRAYAAEIRRTDAALGSLVHELAAQARAPGDVWVVVTADHGEELGEHGLAFHGAQVFEESTRIPLVVWASGPDHRAALPPLLPSSLADVGRYLVAAWEGVGYEPRPVAVSWAPLTGDVAAIEGAHKVIFHARLGLFQVFDLARDPDERAGLITDFVDPARGAATTEIPSWARGLARQLVAGAPWLPARQPSSPGPERGLASR
jgi:hypothetical protein